MGGLVRSLKTVTLVTASFGVVLCGFLVSSAIVEDDVKCLEGVRSNLIDPQGQLSSWNFANSSVGFICDFVGVTCWNNKENRAISLRLHGMKLSGQIPESLKYCQSMQYLNLSSNALSGNIPPQICDWLPYLVTLDLSNNNISGPIPADLANCSFLNVLILSNNRLSGSIPIEFSNLSRLKKLYVANNDLTGVSTPV